MSGILVTFGGIAVLCTSGFVVTTALKWFHTYELDTRNLGKSKKNPQERRGGIGNESRINDIHKRAQSKSSF